MGSKLQFEEAELFLIDIDLNTRQSIKNILHNQGFRKIQQGRSIADVKSFLAETEPDLIISECLLEDDESLAPFIRALRHNETDSNPFIPVIGLMHDPTPEKVSEMISSGVDDLLIKPVSTAQILDRIKKLIDARKIFVVTSEYIGPERRKKGDKRGKSAPTIDVPNPLRARVTGQAEFINIQSAIDAAVKVINNYKLESHANQIDYLIDQMWPDLQRGTIDSRILKMMNRLLYVAEDTGRRMVGTKYAHVFDLCESLIKVTRRICDAGSNANPRDIKLLKPLSEAITAGFDDTEGTAKTAKEISSSIRD